jgi:hypothetical protein
MKLFFCLIAFSACASTNSAIKDRPQSALSPAPFFVVYERRLWLEEKDILPLGLKKRIDFLKSSIGKHNINEFLQETLRAMEVTDTNQLIHLRNGKTVKAKLESFEYANKANWGDCQSTYPADAVVMTFSSTGLLLKNGASVVPYFAISSDLKKKYADRVLETLKSKKAGGLSNYHARNYDKGDASETGIRLSEYLEKATVVIRDKEDRLFFLSDKPSDDFEVGQLHLFDPKSKQFEFVEFISATPCGT